MKQIQFPLPVPVLGSRTVLAEHPPNSVTVHTPRRLPRRGVCFGMNLNPLEVFVVEERAEVPRSKPMTACTTHRLSRGKSPPAYTTTTKTLVVFKLSSVEFSFI